MITPEHLDGETTAPDLPDGYDPDPLFHSAAERRDWEEWEPWKDEDWWHQDGARLSHPEWFDEQRDADFDDEERRP